MADHSAVIEETIVKAGSHTEIISRSFDELWEPTEPQDFIEMMKALKYGSMYEEVDPPNEARRCYTTPNPDDLCDYLAQWIHNCELSDQVPPEIIARLQLILDR